MKKILSAVLAAATLSTATAAIAEGGNWYAGGQLGFAANRTKITGTRAAGTTANGNQSKMSMPMGLQMGWMYSVPGNFFFAAEVGAFYDFSGETKKELTIDGSTGTSKLRKTWGFEFMPKVGYQFNNDWAAYALLGLTTTKFKLSTPTGTTSKFAAGIAPGVGVMYKVDSQWSTNLEYKYQIHQKIERNDAALKTKAEPRAHVITAKVNYNFA